MIIGYTQILLENYSFKNKILVVVVKNTLLRNFKQKLWLTCMLHDMYLLLGPIQEPFLKK